MASIFLASKPIAVSPAPKIAASFWLIDRSDFRMDARDIVLGCSAALLVFAALIQQFRFHFRPAPRNLRKRKTLSHEEIFHRFYPDLDISLEVFKRLWDDIADSFVVCPGIVRPYDVFGKDIPYDGMFGTDEDIFLDGALRRRMKELGVSAPAPDMKCADDYIRFLATHQRRSSKT